MKIELNKTATVLSCECPICGQIGTMRTIEVLPDNGLSMECVHEDGQTSHKWAEYDSADVVYSKDHKGREPKIIICPVCKKRGRVNGYHPHNSAPNIVEYLVTHEKLKGTWGKNKTISKRRRCYIKKPTDREAILKKLGRYIAPPLNSLERYIEK